MRTAIEAVLGAAPGVHAASVVALVAVLYAGCVWGHFDFDTPELLIYNRSVHGLTLENLRAVFTSVPNSVEYLPVRDVTYMLDYELFGMWPGGYHLSNIVWYALGCALCYGFLVSILRRWIDAPRGAALVAALLFAAHPVHVESVAGIAQRKDVVSGAFFFAMLWAFVRWRESRRVALYLASLAACALAMLSKATAVVAPGVILLLVLPDVRRDRRWALEVLGFAILAAAIGTWTARLALEAGTLLSEPEPLAVRALTYAKVSFYYLRMLLLGGPLTIAHGLTPVRSLSEGVGLLALAAVLALAMAIALGARRWPVPAFGGAWFLVTIVPVAGLLPAPNLVADRYLFLPALGVALAAAWVLVEVVRRRRAGAFAAAAAAAVAALSGMTIARAADWRTNESLLRADLEANPSSLHLTRSLGRYYFVNGRYELAFEYFRRARRIAPDSPDLDLFTALRLAQLRDHAGALAALSRVDGAELVDVQCLYGMIYEAMGRPRDAVDAYRRALASRRLLGVLFKKQAQEGLSRLGEQVH
ncbi:MAG TPA: glycosyltransferase family 39 protein [Anaeromyxobacter sp.]|nr:glycosyltransferase family 39 protein [Anaeromyxobacter sp.]